MLKIKDNIDLKELEKFGFKKHKKAYYRCKRNDYIKNLKNGYIEISNDTRLISQDGIEFLRVDEIEYQNTLYDLIEAGYVEKVEERISNENNFISQ